MSEIVMIATPDTFERFPGYPQNITNPHLQPPTSTDNALILFNTRDAAPVNNITADQRDVYGRMAFLANISSMGRHGMPIGVSQVRVNLFTRGSAVVFFVGSQDREFIKAGARMYCANNIVGGVPRYSAVAAVENNQPAFQTCVSAVFVSDLNANPIIIINGAKFMSMGDVIAVSHTNVAGLLHVTVVLH